MSILNQNLLTLDFWQNNKVTYAGHTLPTGGTLDKQTAAVMKRLAKNKMEWAISDHVYAKGSYEAEMSQDVLLKEANIKI